MKYIRTKDGRVRELDFDYRTGAFTGNGYYRYKATPTEQANLVHKNYIINQADTIEELCDEFVGIDSQGHYIIHNDKWLDGARIIPLEDVKYYGAIWTDKGLIYVAKMNDEGELELL